MRNWTLGVLSAAVAAAAWAPVPARAEETPDLALLGARARAMGGAYIAVASGVDAVGWNPAGLSEVERPQLAADSRLNYGSGNVTRGLETFSIEGLEESQVLDESDSPGSSFTYYLIGGAIPVRMKGRAEEIGLVAAANYRRVIDFLFLQEQLVEFDAGGGVIIPFEHIDDSSGGVDAFTLSLAGRAMPQVSVGVNVNLLTGFIQDVDVLRVAFEGTDFFLQEERVRHTIDGHSFELGAQAQVLPQLTVGAVLRPGFDVKHENGRGQFRLVILEGGPQEPQNFSAGFPAASRTVEVPTMYGVGVAGTPLPGLTVAGDFQYRPWNESRTVVHSPSGGSDIVVDPRLYEAHTFHLGSEYVFNRDQNVRIPLRLGFRTTPTTLANADSLSVEVGPNGFRTFRGDRVESHTWSGGVGIHFPTVGFDISIDRTKLTFAEFSEFFDTPPLPGQPLRIVEIEETLTNLYFSSTIRF